MGFLIDLGCFIVWTLVRVDLRPSPNNDQER